MKKRICRSSRYNGQLFNEVNYKNDKMNGIYNIIKMGNYGKK